MTKPPYRVPSMAEEAPVEALVAPEAPKAEEDAPPSAPELPEAQLELF